MGRKSVKGKEKKAKRKEDAARINQNQDVVDAANALEDPMAGLVAFKKFDRNGLQATISCLRRDEVDKDTIDWAFQLTKTNMQAMYEASDWGWSDAVKHEEMEDERARYLIARDSQLKPLAYVHFRFDLDECIEVLYCYEIQLEKEARRKGLGKFLMQILELMAFKTNMKQVMLTIFKHNPDAVHFFKDKLQYTVDESSPVESYVEAVYDEDGYTYEILSKPIKSKQVAPSKPLTESNKQEVAVQQ